MKHRPTPQQTDSYQDNGFVVIEDFLDPRELETWRLAVDGATASRTSRLTDRPDTPNEYVDSVFTQRVNLWTTDSKMKELMLDERLGILATELAGVGRRFESGTIRP